MWRQGVHFESLVADQWVATRLRKNELVSPGLTVQIGQFRRMVHSDR